MNKHFKGQSVPLAALAALVSVASSPAMSETGAQPVDLSQHVFELTGAPRYEFKEIAGRPAVCLDGVALLRGTSMTTGSIAVDIAVTRERHFGGIAFRARDMLNYEEVYLRMHKSRQADAVQYAPVLNGEGNWQLFGTRQIFADFGDDDWVNLRVDYDGDRAAVTVDGASEAKFWIEDLVLDEVGGGLGLSSIGGACFSNLRINEWPDFGEERFSDEAADQSGIILSWSLSPTMSFSSFPTRSPARTSEWMVTDTERDGLLLVSRHRDRDSEAVAGRTSAAVVYGAASLHSERETLAELEFDASDRVRVYLNGNPLVEIDNSFRAKGALFRGDFAADRQRVFLPLKKGENHLVMGVADSAHGWGFKARIVSDEPVDTKPF